MVNRYIIALSPEAMFEECSKDSEPTPLECFPCKKPMEGKRAPAYAILRRPIGDIYIPLCEDCIGRAENES